MVKAYKLQRRSSETLKIPFTTSKSFSRRFLLEADDLYPLLQDKKNRQKEKKKNLYLTIMDYYSLSQINVPSIIFDEERGN